MTEKCLCWAVTMSFFLINPSIANEQTNLVSEKMAAKFKGCLLGEWIKMLAKEWDANYIHKQCLQVLTLKINSNVKKDTALPIIE